MDNRFLLIPSFFISLFLLIICSGRIASAGPVFPGNVVWDSPSNDPTGNMPLGNGDVAGSVWAESGNGISMYLLKADVFGENDSSWECPVPKLGRLDLSFTSGAFQSGQSFSQVHNTDSGVVEISSGPVRVKLWADANMPVIHITMESDNAMQVQCALETWRTETVQADGQSGVISYYRFGTPFRWSSFLPHDMIDRIYGCKVGAPEGWTVSGKTVSGSIGPEPTTINVTMLNIVSPEPQQWLDSIKELHERCLEVPVEEAYAGHCAWWKQFYSRSWIHTSGFNEAERVNTFHACQRFVNACAGRSRVPIHFNGSVFSVGEGGNPDYKKWGGAYWMCNTKCIYWPLLETGDWDMMQAFFSMYGRREVQEANVKQAFREFGIPGGYIHEIVNRTGCAYQDAWTFPDYQWHYFSSGLEYLSIALDYWSMSGDNDLLRENIIPTAYNLVLFYKSYGNIGGDGKLHWEDINALETYWRATDPACDVGGLMWVLRYMANVDKSLMPDTVTQLFEEMQGLLPPLPMSTEGGRTRILPCLVDQNDVNRENPELYTVFPYRLFTTGKPGLDTGRFTWENRLYGGLGEVGAWWTHGLQTAYLGWPDYAQTELLARITDSRGFRFPVYFTYGDYPPCQCFINVPMKTVQAMLIQADDGKILLLPAWPPDWNVEFKLYTLEQTSVEVKYENREITYISVLPAERYDDIEVMNGAALPANGVAKKSITSGFVLRPVISFLRNGADSHIRIDPNCKGQWSFCVVDMAGRTMLKSEKMQGQITLDANKLAAGVYLCTVKSAQGVSFAKSLAVAD